MFLTTGHKASPLARNKPLLAVIARFFFVFKKFLNVRLISLKRISAERPSDPANLNNKSIIVDVLYKSVVCTQTIMMIVLSMSFFSTVPCSIMVKILLNGNTRLETESKEKINGSFRIFNVFSVVFFSTINTTLKKQVIWC